jgi:glycerol-3-phosphate O-acyltransferase
MLDDISQAVLAREEVLKYLRGNYGESGAQAREKIYGYLEELRTTQRHAIYRALQHPLYPILRKIERKHENLHYVTSAIRSHRIALKAYVAEILKKHDLFFYPEGGRSYSGELKPAKTGLFNAALSAERSDMVIIPVAVAYDLVLEDHILAHQSVKKRQRPFSREVAEMVRYAVGYRSRAFVTFGAPIAAGDRDVHSRSDVLELARLVRARTGLLYKVLPTALFAAAMRPSIARHDLESRIDRLIEELAARHANLAVTSGRQAVEEAAEPLETRGIVVAERGRFRVRERTVLRYYARTIEHLLVTTGRTH